MPGETHGTKQPEEYSQAMAKSSPQEFARPSHMYIYIYRYIYIYIYIYPPAPFRGPPGCEAYVCSCCLRVLPVQQSAIVSLPVWYLLLAVCKSSNSVESNCLLGPGTDILPPTRRLPSIWVPPGHPCKIIKFQPCLWDPQESEKMNPRALK